MVHSRGGRGAPRRLTIRLEYAILPSLPQNLFDLAHIEKGFKTPMLTDFSSKSKVISNDENSFFQVLYLNACRVHKTNPVLDEK